MMMEIERLKAIKAEHDREERAAQARQRGKQVIIDQIASRQEQRQKEQEEFELEKAQMLSNIEKVRREDAAALAAKKKQVQIMQEEVAIANKQSLKAKEAARETAVRMDNEITEFQRKKDEREEQKAKEVQRIKEEKEREVQRLRDMQERANDRQAELDGKRAQKAYEMAELEHRAREKAKAQKQREDVQNLHLGRQRQFADNDSRLKQ